MALDFSCCYGLGAWDLIQGFKKWLALQKVPAGMKKCGLLRDFHLCMSVGYLPRWQEAELSSCGAIQVWLLALQKQDTRHTVAQSPILPHILQP